MSDPDDASHALLLRLFQSEFFSPHLALSYLRTYSDSIGITYYLVEQLRSAFDSTEVEFYWAQLCHLLITKPSKSRALEYFILQRCDESVHVALLTLWYFQAALFDLSSNPHTDSFHICQRVYNQCQRLLYDDPLADTDVVTSYSGSNLGLGSLRRKLRIKAKSKKGERILPSNVLPNFVGMGTVISSVPGMPTLASFAGNMAIEQGRRKPQGRDRTPLEGSGMQREPYEGDESDDSDNLNDEDNSSEEGESETDPARHSEEKFKLSKANSNVVQNEDPKTDSNVEIREAEKQRISQQHASPRTPQANRTDSIDKNGNVPSHQSSQKDGANPFAQFTTGFNELRGKAAAAVNDVFGQSFGVEFSPGTKPRDAETPAPLWHRQHRRKESSRSGKADVEVKQIHLGGDKSRTASSTPNLLSRSSVSFSPLNSTSNVADESSLSAPDILLARYDTEARRRLLRSNYCRKQTDFLQNLQDISARLLLLPKPARLSALRAELTELNHGLPSEVCFPLWCEAAAQDGQENSDATHNVASNTHKKSRGNHHRVLRINPSEAVVLNSADRVPFLLHVEVLKDDLNFDPERKQNRESLKKLVMQEDVRRRKTALSRTFSSPSGGHVGENMSRTDVSEVNSKVELGAKSHNLQVVAKEEATPGIATVSSVSQPSGQTLQPSTDEDGSGGTIICEEVDLTEQVYGSDLAAFGEERRSESDDEDDLATMNLSHDNAAWSHNANDASVAANQRKEEVDVAASTRKAFSLDEYSERMRTAAVMLAQLNQSTNASAHPIVASNPHVSSTAQGGWSSWIMGTSWAAASHSSKHSEIGQGSAGVKAPVTTSNGSTPAIVSNTVTAGNAGLGNTGRGSGTRLMNTDTEMIRKRIMHEMMALEEERMERMKVAVGNRRTRRANGTGVEDEATVQRAVNKDDPSAAMFRESWAAKKARIRTGSPYGHLDNWDVLSVIVKTGADLRQEQLAVQLVQEFSRIWGETGSRCWVRYFRILVTSENSGIMETVTDAVSVHSIKKEAYSRQQSLALQTESAQAQQTGKIATYSLLDHFIATYGDPSSAKFGKARQRFIESLAGYSIVSYLLQIKDRHNGNILVDGEGHLIHIDFGFMLGISPGGVGFEAAPFKMPQEYIDVMGGVDSPKFLEFKGLVCQGFRDIRKHAERIIMIVELMQKDSKLPCFALGDLTASYLRDRFQLALSQAQCDEFVDRLITSSLNSAFTRLYDQYQYYSEGILS